MVSSSLRRQMKRSNHFNAMYRLCRLASGEASETAAAASARGQLDLGSGGFVRRQTRLWPRQIGCEELL